MDLEAEAVPRAVAVDRQAAFTNCVPGGCIDFRQFGPCFGRSYRGGLALVLHAPLVFDEPVNRLQTGLDVLLEGLLLCEGNGLLNGDGPRGFKLSHELAGRLRNQLFSLDDAHLGAFLLRLLGVSAIRQKVHRTSGNNRPAILSREGGHIGDVRGLGENQGVDVILAELVANSSDALP